MSDLLLKYNKIMLNSSKVIRNKSIECKEQSYFNVILKINTFVKIHIFGGTPQKVLYGNTILIYLSNVRNFCRILLNAF